MAYRSELSMRQILKRLAHKHDDGWTQTTGENIRHLTGEDIPITVALNTKPVCKLWALSQYPLYVKKCKVGAVREVGSQVISKQLFNFDAAAMKLVAKFKDAVINQSLLEVHQEEELRFYQDKLDAFRIHDFIREAKFNRRKIRELDFAERIVKYIDLGLEEREIDYETVDRIKAGTFAMGVMANMTKNAVRELRDNGFLPDGMLGSIESKFQPWLEMKLFDEGYMQRFCKCVLDGFIEKSLYKRREEYEIESKKGDPDRDIFDVLDQLDLL